MSHNTRFSLIYIIVFLLLFFSCEKNKSKLIADYKKDLTIYYKKDSILIDYGEGELEKYFKINNEYYLIEDNKKKLFFSTLSDTIYYDIHEEFRYKVEIKKINSVSPPFFRQFKTKQITHFFLI
ncbi:MAG: hypothetical protein WCY25_10180 [Moheibacter sp.]